MFSLKETIAMGLVWVPADPKLVTHSFSLPLECSVLWPSTGYCQWEYCSSTFAFPHIWHAGEALPWWQLAGSMLSRQRWAGQRDTCTQSNMHLSPSNPVCVICWIILQQKLEKFKGQLLGPLSSTLSGKGLYFQGKCLAIIVTFSHFTFISHLFLTSY